MFGIIETGGKQYKVSVGDQIKIEKVEGEVGSKVVFDKVLLSANGEDVKIGKPYVSGSQISGEILAQEKGKKLIVFKYKPKKRQRTKNGHRQEYTKIKITEIK